MPQVIEIKNCLDCQFIDRDELKYRTDIIATNCTWKENAVVDYTLQQQPFETNTYLVMLHQPVRFSLNMNLWLFYNCPLAYYNGYETKGEVEQARFCFGEITEIISYDESAATIHFTVKQVLSFEDILNLRTPQPLPGQWINTLKGFIERGKCFPEQFGDYYQLDLNFEGDLGLLCIIKKTAEDYFICMIQEWCFSEEYTYGAKYVLPPIVRKLMQEYDTSSRY